MSGSSGSGGGGYAEPILRCETISFSTDVNSPQQDALEGLQVNHVLDIKLSNNTVVVIRKDNQKLLGSINWTSILKLNECLSDGYKYIAVVRLIQDGLVTIHVSAEKGN